MIDTDAQHTVDNESFHQLTELVKAYVAEARKTDRIRTILQTLHFEEMRQREQYTRMAYDRTFAWAFENDTTSLPNWLRSGSGIYWISGKPGSGKSTFMKFVLRNPETRLALQKWSAGKPVLLPSYFFWNPGTLIQKNLHGFARSLLFDILVEVPQLAETICPDRWNAQSWRLLQPWDTEELLGCLDNLASVQDLPVKICVFVDALDEFDADDEDSTVIIHVLQRLLGSDQIKICASSRPWSIFHESFRMYPSLSVHELTRGDIEIYVEDNLRMSEPFRHLESCEPQAASDLKAYLTEHAQGVFLWVFLVSRSVLRGLSNSDTVEELRRRLDELPSDLEDFFRVMLHRIEPVYWEQTAILLKTLTVMRTPLPVSVFWAADEESSIPTREVAFAPAKGEPMPPEAKKLAMNAANAFAANSGKHNNIVRKGASLEAQCKDFICINDSHDEPKPNGMIILLHRTVADFLSLSEISAVIDARLPGGFNSELFLAKAFMALIRRRLIHDPRRYDTQLSKWIIWVLYLARNLKGSFLGEQISILDELNLSVDGMNWAAILSTHTPTRSEDLIHERLPTIAPRLGFMWFDFLSAADSQSKRISITRCLISALKPAIILHLSDGINCEYTSEADINMVQLLLTHNDSKAAIKSPEYYDPWSRFLVTLKEPTRLKNAFELCRLLIASGAPRFVDIETKNLTSTYAPDEKRVKSVDSMSIIAEVFSTAQVKQLSDLYKENDQQNKDIPQVDRLNWPRVTLIMLPYGALAVAVLAYLVLQLLSQR